MLPGLTDAHSHLGGNGQPDALDRLPGLSPDDLDEAVEASLTAQLAAGVTAVRDLGDDRRGRRRPAPQTARRADRRRRRTTDHPAWAATARAWAARRAAPASCAARACGLADRTGRLRTGLDVDLLLADGVPATDITAIRNLRTVVSRGQAAYVAGAAR